MSASRFLTLCVSCAMAFASTLAFAATERINPNDNRTPAGKLDHGTLALHLEARAGDWYPDGDDDPSVTVKAFAIEGQPLQVPAPLVRVVEGTEIAASIRNRLDEPLIVRGLYSRPAKAGGSDVGVTIAPREVKEIRFVAGSPGTYFYWGASTPDAVVGRRLGKDTQLSGAFIVDPRDGARVPDRVLVITGWNSSTNNIPTANTVGRIVINGKSWPNTERLTYDVNDTVHLRVLNVGNLVHPMHLHGFYFRVDSRGDERADSIYPPSASPRWANTERLTPGRTFSLTWVPTRSGNWLFHCHDSIHIRRSKPLDSTAMPAPSDIHEMNHALEMMSGPVIGITVRAAKDDDAAPAAGARRRLHLLARVDSGGTPTEPAYGFSLEDEGKTTPPTPPYSVGPTIVLKRGEPVSITVENKLPEATSVHWHGIELESYYDGVPGFAGNPGRIAPAIAAGGSFEARFTPPRSGTFIYHTHVDEMRQQQAGLNGALIVVDSPASYDPGHDIVLLITTPRNIADDNVVLLNGTANPPAREFHVGERYRLRLINVHVSRPNIFVRLFRDKALVAWRAIAKDGMDLPPDLATVGPAEVQIGNGETFDFEFQPTTVGDNLIEVRGAGGALLTSMAIQVR